MLYRFRVHLPGIKGFARTYLLKPGTTLYSFSKKMGEDMAFPQDVLVLFKATDPTFTTAFHRYSTIDLGSGTIDCIRIENLVKAGETFFQYFYDTVNKNSVLISLEEEVDEKSVDTRFTSPLLEFVKGPNPIEFLNGYVAFEDIPKTERVEVEDSKKPKKSLAEALFGSDGDDDLDDEDFDDDDEDFDDDEDGKEIYGNEFDEGEDEEDF